jgi:hypothetical protein
MCNTLLIGFPRQQWLRERASFLLYTYITLVVNIFYTAVSWHVLAGSNLAEGCGFCVYCFMVMFDYESFTFPSMGR